MRGTGMTERGPDSAGLAVYTEPVSDDMHKLSLYSGEHAVDWPALLAGLREEFSAHSAIAINGNHAVLTSAVDPDRAGISFGADYMLYLEAAAGYFTIHGSNLTFPVKYLSLSRHITSRIMVAHIGQTSKCPAREGNSLLYIKGIAIKGKRPNL